MIPYFLIIAVLAGCSPSPALDPTVDLENPSGTQNLQPETTEGSPVGNPNPATKPPADPTVQPMATPTPEAPLTPLGQRGDWELIFQDEFDDPELDPTRWTTCYWWDREGCTNKSNNELEWYRQENVSIVDGVLRLTAKEQEIEASDGMTYRYTSGMVTTGPSSSIRTDSPRFSFRYGYAEIRARVPKGQGLWPAFWLLPDSLRSTPEIDVLEILGHAPDVIEMYFHYFKANGEETKTGGEWDGPDFSRDWHVFGVDWQPDQITWHVDGIERFRFTESQFVPTIPMYMILNLAVGGNWPGSPDESTPFPSTFEIDYVRVFHRSVLHTLDPIEDTYVDETRTSENYGEEETLYSDGEPIKRIFLKFDTSELAGAIIDSAYLRIMTTADVGSPSNDLHEIMILDNHDWSERELTFLSQPPLEGKLIGTVRDATWVWSVYEIPLDVTILQPRLGDLLTLTIGSSGTDGLYLGAKEGNSAGVQLIILTKPD
jgi:beta-glucanase (GH16 family)